MIDVLIVGGGPSGLATALLMLQSGHSVRVLEARDDVGGHSRAIGIHPPGLAVLDRVGVGPELSESGVRITRGVGISRKRVVAELDFGFLPVANPFVLALPQEHTVRRLRQRLAEADADAFLGGVEFQRFTSRPGHHNVWARTPEGNTLEFECRFLIGADGSRSAVRKDAAVPFNGTQLPDHYVMGDYPDSTAFGSVAALFLHHEGIVESFPLPGGMRRWVSWIRPDETTDLAGLVARRTGHSVDPAGNSMYSRFQTANHLVDRMNHGTMVLIGDAAHEVSPIGGQGMTLGLLDASALAPILDASLNKQLDARALSDALSLFSTRRLAAAARAGRQARINMALGKPLWGSIVPVRDGVARALLKSDRFSRTLAATFTMCHRR